MNTTSPSRNSSCADPLDRRAFLKANALGCGEHETGPSNWTLVRRLFGLGWKYRTGCAWLVLQQTLLVVLSLSGLGLTGLGIDVIRHALDPASVPPRWPFGFAPPDAWSPMAVTGLIAGLILLAAVLHAGFRFTSAVAAGQLVQDIVVDLRSAVYDQLQRLSFRFYDANRSGSIINRVAGDVQAVRMFVDGVVVQMLTVAISLAAYLVYMLRVHVPLTLACLATTPLLWIGAVLFSRRVRPAYLRNSELVDDLVLTLSENVQGMHVVKGFAREPEEIAKFQAANRRVLEQKRGIFWTISLFQPVMGFLTQVNMLVLLGYGSYLAIRGEIRLGEGLFVFANLLHQFANQVGQITAIANSIQASLTGAERVFEVLDAPVEIRSPPHPTRLPKATGRIEFRDVAFAYHGDERVLDGLTFDVQPGQCLAIVGATGAGKSTLLSLLPRFYDPIAGTIRLDGHDLRTLDLTDLRRNIGIVFQESFLFSNTAAANIAFGHPEATFEQIERAAKLACADEFIRQLPHGYDTLIGEHGANLSGGQRQRLAIARALLLEPSILILDDATAAVDPETEEEILAAMDNAMQGRTTFVTAHRLSTLRRADFVLVLDKGRLVQSGRHAELMQQAGHYRDAALIQQLAPQGQFRRARRESARRLA